jgi:DNA ligase (NAD+)
MKSLLDSACEAYYTGTPFLSDEEFDFLSEKYNYNSVGHQVTDAIPHAYRMYSLQKVFDIANSPLYLPDCIKSPKLDGAAVSILYVNGELHLALTRGDGIEGRDITDKMKWLVPTYIDIPGVRQITGEVVAPSSIPNARNYAAGALNLKDIEEFSKRDLTFVAYDVVPSFTDSWQHGMTNLKEQGIDTVNSFDSTNYPTDGTVYRLDCNNQFKFLGNTSKHPHGAFALKEQKAGVVTKLLEVKWQVGKSGVVSPVAILEPVEIGGAVVSRATLHNIDYIRALNLQLECLVEVIRSGEIIPRIVRRVS